MTRSPSSSSSTIPRDPAVASRASKRSIEQVHDCLLIGSLEELAARKNAPVSLTDIRDVLLEQLLGGEQTDIKHTVLFVCEEVPDLRPKEVARQATLSGEKDAAVAANVDLLEGLENDYQYQCRLSEGDSIPRCDATLLRFPVSERDKEKEKHAAKKAVKKKIKKFKKSSGESAKPSAEFYVLSPDELRVHLPSVPFEDAGAAAEYVSTKALLDGETRSDKQLFLALDCEMCRTTKGVELTRVTLIDASEKVLLDEYVRPKNPIVDYCTQYSGITREIMEATDIRLADIQKRFLSLVPAEAILVGHSIENDLLALRVLHRRVIDTACMYPHPRGPPFRSALRFLTSQFLSRVIQTNTDGHCSVEDAVATLQLAQLKIKRGPLFPRIEHEYKQKKVVHEMAQAKKSVLIVDSQRSCRSLSGGVACIIPREDSREVIQAVVHQLTTGFPPHLTWARVREVKRSEIVKYVLEIKANLPKHSCLVTVICGDTSDLRALHKCRTARIDPRSSLMWDKEQQDRLNATALATQTGIVHVYLQ